MTEEACHSEAGAVHKAWVALAHLAKDLRLIAQRLDDAAASADGVDLADLPPRIATLPPLRLDVGLMLYKDGIPGDDPARIALVDAVGQSVIGLSGSTDDDVNQSGRRHHATGKFGDVQFKVSTFVDGKTTAQQLAALQVELAETRATAMRKISALEASVRAGDAQLDEARRERDEARIALADQLASRGEAAAQQACSIAVHGTPCGLPPDHFGDHVPAIYRLCGRQSDIWDREYCGKQAGHGGTCTVLSPPNELAPDPTDLTYWWGAPTPTRRDGPVRLDPPTETVERGHS